MGNIAKRDNQESVTTGQTDARTDRQTPDKVIPMCRFALQTTQKPTYLSRLQSTVLSNLRYFVFKPIRYAMTCLKQDKSSQDKGDWQVNNLPRVILFQTYAVRQDMFKTFYLRIDR